MGCGILKKASASGSETLVKQPPLQKNLTKKIVYEFGFSMILSPRIAVICQDRLGTKLSRWRICMVPW
jgi:hypothetical protein